MCAAKGPRSIREQLSELYKTRGSLSEAIHNGLYLVAEACDFPEAWIVVHIEDAEKPLLQVGYPDFESALSVEKQAWLQQLKKKACKNDPQVVEGGWLFPLRSAGSCLGFLWARICDQAQKLRNIRACLQETSQEFADWISHTHSSQSSFYFHRDRKRIFRAYDDFDANTPLDELEIRLVNEVREILGCEAAAIVFWGMEPDEVFVKKALISRRGWVYNVRITHKDGLAGRCLVNGVPVISNAPAAEPEYLERIDFVPGLEPRSLLYAPLLDNGSMVGLLQVLNRKGRSFNEADLELLNRLGQSISKPLVLLQTIQQLRALNAHLETSRWELIRSRNILRNLIDNLPDSLYIISQQYRIIAVNTARAKRAGVDLRTLVGGVCYEVFYRRDCPCPGCLVPTTFINGRVNHRSVTAWGESGEVIDWEISTYPILDETATTVQAIVVEKDVTDRRRMEVMVAQSEKMMAVGQLAAGIAHEINNPLTVVLANAQILMRELPDAEDWRELAGLINTAGDRALHAVRNLLDFARREEYDLEETDVNETMRHALELLQHEFSDRQVILAYQPDAALPPRKASPENLQSVWVNLLMNALDSVEPGKGRVVLASHYREHEIHVAITDNGHGIPTESIHRIFEPFYTTKDPGKGTGLGLSICHRIIKQHGGHIDVESRVGEGTTFTVILPAG